MTQLRVLMLFIKKQDTPPSSKAGELVPDAQTLNHLAMRPFLLHYKASLPQNVRHLKRANSAKRIIIHHFIIRFSTGKMSKHGSTASALNSTTRKLSGTPLSFPLLIFRCALETALQILDKFIMRLGRDFYLRTSPSSPSTALLTNKTTPTRSAAS